MRDEPLNVEIFNTLTEARVVIEPWRKHYKTAAQFTGLSTTGATDLFTESITIERTKLNAVNWTINLVLIHSQGSPFALSLFSKPCSCEVGRAVSSLLKSILIPLVKQIGVNLPSVLAEFMKGNLIEG
jgi:hypothetical protein